MMTIWKVLGIGAAVGAGITAMVQALGGSKESSPSATEDNGVLEDRTGAPDDDGDDLYAEGRALIETLGRRGGMTEEQIRFLVFVARNESKFHPDVGRGDPALRPPGLREFYDDKSESLAAKAAYERNAAVFADCGHDPSDYYFGSGGLFAFLPTYPLYHLRKTPLRCASPYEVFDPAFSMTAAYSFARGITQHPAFDGTVLELRVGWGSLKRMQDPAAYAGRIPLYTKQLRQLGIDEGWLKAQAPQWPKRDLMALYRSMGGSYGAVA